MDDNYYIQRIQMIYELMDLGVIDMDHESEMRITDGQGNSQSIRIEPNENRIVFLADRNRQRQRQPRKRDKVLYFSSSHLYSLPLSLFFDRAEYSRNRNMIMKSLRNSTGMILIILQIFATEN